MVKSRRSRQVFNWQEKTQMRSHSTILVGKEDFHLVKEKPEEQIKKIKKNHELLDKQIKKIEAKMFRSRADPVETARLQFILSKRQKLFSKSFLRLYGPQGLVEKIKAQEKREETKRENLKKEMQEHIRMVENVDKAIKQGKKPFKDTLYPSRFKQKVDTVGGKRRVINVIPNNKPSESDFKVTKRRRVKGKMRSVFMTNVQHPEDLRTYVAKDEKE